MTLITSKYFTDPSETALHFNTETGWQAVSKGLRLIAAGYFILIGGTIAGLLLLRLGLEDGPAIVAINIRFDDRENLLLLGVLTLGLTAVFSYGFILLGQWHCLMYAPQGHHAKELIYICFNCLLVGSALNAVGAYLDGARTYAALRQGLAEVEKLNPWSPGNLLQLGSAGLGLFGSLVFSQFLRSVATCFQDQGRVRAADLYLSFMGLLLGGSIGTLFFVKRLSFRTEFFPWLVTGWLLCFIWHLYLVRSASRGVDEGLLRSSGVNTTGLSSEETGSIAIHTLSGLHRLAQRAQH
jgi:hypothetical protein